MGDDVWIGHGAVILPGIPLGTGAAIGAGAIVTKDVPSFTIVVGNPGRILRFRFPEDIQAVLLRIRCWQWPHALRGERMADFRLLGAEAFCRKYEPA